MKKLYFFLIFFLSIFVTKTQEIPLSFDSLFPISFFEQALKATMQVWHTLKHENFASNQHCTTMCDQMLGQLTSAHFCLKQMYVVQQAVHGEDVQYLHAILQEIKRAIMVYEIDVTDQRIVCMVGVIEKMQNILTPIQ